MDEATQEQVAHGGTDTVAYAGEQARRVLPAMRPYRVSRRHANSGGFDGTSVARGCCPTGAMVGSPWLPTGRSANSAVLEQSIVQNQCAGYREIEREASGNAHDMAAVSQHRR